ncbi:hypothetical protein UFOVP581_4 [uncultured Caudovirales phage]|uniref:Uncharacterized protein n=1 Tax=uncultured Caudovirales phage TaxID=2100421 RepID=A0A6J5PCI7_9CAUD|nr:hypothetical protein UFOVP581_4 [uncultured Caudovirales phage]
MIIGIDPDIEKSGVANLAGGQLNLYNAPFFNLIRGAQLDLEIHNFKHHFYIEAGWLNKKASWHAADNKSVAAAIGRKVGENHAVGKLLVECLRAIGHEVTEVKPTRTKLNADKFKALTGYEGRTNQEQRDAAMLIWHLRNTKT